MPNATRSNTIISSKAIAAIALSRSRSPGTIWSLGREASLNWLALGLLLAAWNASDNDLAPAPHPPTHSVRRPEALRGYAHISVRAVNRAASER
jgi:hypothetical protein